MTILTEALDRYEVDGLFFNMFGNPAADYSGNPMGPCQCDACQVRYRARYGRARAGGGGCRLPRRSWRTPRARSRRPSRS